MAEERQLRPHPDTLDGDALYPGAARVAQPIPADGDTNLTFSGDARRDPSAKARAEQADPLPAPLLPRRRAPKAGLRSG